MPTASFTYKLAGIQRLLSFKTAFDPANQAKKDYRLGEVNKFIDLFCEYQLADNNYMNIHLEAGWQKDNPNWVAGLSLQDVLKYLTYIIWTDKFIDGYITTKIEDGSFKNLLERLEQLQETLVVSPANQERH